MGRVLRAIDEALEIIDKNEEERRALELAWEKLPLFRPGCIYSAAEAAGGFRVPHGCSVHESNLHRVRVGPRAATHEDKNIVYFPSYKGDGLDWVYFDDTIRNSAGLSLAACIAKHGIGTHINMERDVRAKAIYLDADKLFERGKCFILAIDRPSQGRQMRVNCNEQRSTTRRISRGTDADAERLNAIWVAAQHRDGKRVIDDFWHISPEHAS